MKINRLTRHLSNLIAAGEVVERPGSVVKELAENSIDSGASALTVEIKNGGMSYIRVTDDGCGMDPQDAPTAFLRHATSKISEESDLAAIGTLGFRGEALAAIAAVSRVEMLTKVKETDEGVFLSLEAGQALDTSPAGCPDGTTVIVRDLFFNTPARLKFTKRDSAEGAYCASVAAKLALAHPEVSVKFVKDGALQLSTPGDGRLQSAVYAVFGREEALSMLEAVGVWDKVSVNGYVSSPAQTRGNRNYQHFFVNGRYIKSKLIQAAVEQAYKNRIMTGRYPACVLHVTLPEAEVDVNVHPAKTEVKFQNENMVFEGVYHAVQAALGLDGGKPGVSLGQKPSAAGNGFFKNISAEEFNQSHSYEKPDTTPPKADAGELKTPARLPYNTPLDSTHAEIGGISQLRQTSDIPYITNRTGADIYPAPPPDPTAPQQAALIEDEPYYRVVGEIMKTYIVVEESGGMVLIDKHAAHERVIFERMKAAGTGIMSQSLLTPIITEPNPQEKEIILESAGLLQDHGFEVEDFGGESIAIRRVPSDIDSGDAAAALSEIAGRLLEGNKADPESARDEILHTLACKAAIKAGSLSGMSEFEELTREVMTNPNIKYCPHGRPVAVSISRHELEKQFKRI